MATGGGYLDWLGLPPTPQAGTKRWRYSVRDGFAHFGTPPVPRRAGRGLRLSHVDIEPSDLDLAATYCTEALIERERTPPLEMVAERSLKAASGRVY